MKWDHDEQYFTVFLFVFILSETTTLTTTVSTSNNDWLKTHHMTMQCVFYCSLQKCFIIKHYYSLTAAATTTPWTGIYPLFNCFCRNHCNYKIQISEFVFILSSAPAIFYPFGAKAGDIEILENDGDTFYHVVFSTPFTYFGRTYNSIYVRIQFYG